MPPMGALDWIGLIVPFVVFFVMLIVYYVWEGRRERRLREKYEGEGEHVE